MFDGGGKRKRTDHGETPAERARDHLAHIDSYTAREIEKIRALAKAGHLSLEALGDAIKELIRASTSNPLIGAAVVVIIADILRTAKVLSPAASQLIFIMAGTGFGVAIGVEVVSAIDGFLPWSHAPSGDTDVLRPTGQTFVYPNEAAKSSGTTPTIPAGALGLATRIPEIAEIAA